MIAIGIRFPAGRYHATPWGRHVNEGALEWPPSPWRLLRALVAVWKRKLDDALGQERVAPILNALATPPDFHLPPASFGHTRHYMPLRFPHAGDRTKVFDAFVSVSKPPSTEQAENISPILVEKFEVQAFWPDADLSPESRADLALLLNNLNFLGRVEAWCDARLLDPVETASLADNRVLNCQPLTPGRPAASDTEPVRVLCADPAGAFQSTHTPKIERVEGSKKTRQVFSDPLYDPDWHLCAETLWLHEKKWSAPPGSQWVTYARRRDCFQVNPTSTHRQPAVTAARPGFQVARFALDSTVLPLVTQTLPVAESARRTLMGVYGRLHPIPGSRQGHVSALFSGKDATGEPLTGHAHAYYLPTDEDGDGRLDHLTVVAAAGFGPGEIRAFDELRRLADRERDDAGHPLRVLLLGLGRLDGSDLPVPFRPSPVWLSATPFVATRFPKTGDRQPGTPLDVAAFLERLLRQELRFLFDARPEHFTGVDPEQVSIRPLQDENGVFRLPNPRTREPVGCRPLQFQRFRRKRGDDGGQRHSGYFEIDFGRPVAGPIVLGHSNHFGLGMFLPYHDE